MYIERERLNEKEKERPWLFYVWSRHGTNDT